jgi:peptidylprolyl isomerase
MRTLPTSRPRRAGSLGAIALSAALLLGVSACGGDGSSDTGAQPTNCELQIGTDLATKPTIVIPDCATKPTRPQFKDLIPGDGPQAREGDSVSVKYVGVSWSNREQFDASWDRGADSTFPVNPLGRASVIAGWNQGLVGARAGSRRLLVLPPDVAYGAAGRAPIAPNETLVFVVDVVSVDPPVAPKPSQS